TSLNMSAEDFLSRCKTIHDSLKEIKTGSLKAFLIEAGVQKNALKELGNLKLLQGIQNILSSLIENRETISSWKDAASQINWKQENPSLSALFINNDIRQVDAHIKINEEIKALERLGFDSAQLYDGYGKALDFMFDKII
ncbi:MAG: hypothetical protein JSR33_04670, partial [Proteobacteria bacterium]|nr:hypothetical protein [Pseudomonadota bacterium]